MSKKLVKVSDRRMKADTALGGKRESFRWELRAYLTFYLEQQNAPTRTVLRLVVDWSGDPIRDKLRKARECQE